MSPGKFLYAMTIVAKYDLLLVIRYPSALISNLIWPFLYIGAALVTAKGLVGPSNEGLELFARVAQTSDYLTFILLGNILFATMNTCLWHGGLALSTARQQGVLETHWLLPQSGLAFIFGKTFSAILQQLLPTILVLWVAYAFHLTDFKVDLTSLAVLMLASMPFLLGGLIVSAVFTLRVMENGFFILGTRTILSIICGISFPLAVLPTWLRALAEWFPLAQMLVIARSLFIHQTEWHEHWKNLTFILASGLALLWIAVAFYRYTERRVRRLGLIGGH